MKIPAFTRLLLDDVNAIIQSYVPEVADAWCDYKYKTQKRTILNRTVEQQTTVGEWEIEAGTWRLYTTVRSCGGAYRIMITGHDSANPVLDVHVCNNDCVEFNDQRYVRVSSPITYKLTIVSQHILIESCEVLVINRFHN